MATVFVLATTAVIIPSTIAIYDQFLLLPGVFFLCTHYDKILRATVPVRVLGLIALGSLAWQWVGACAEAIAHWLSPNLIHSSRALLLPLRTAASVPFAFTALLCFVAFRKFGAAKIPPTICPFHDLPKTACSCFRFRAGRVCNADRAKAR